MLYNNSNSSTNVQMFGVEPRKQLRTAPPSQTQFLPFRLRDIRDRKNPDAGPAPPGNLRSSSPISWANSVPGRSISLVILLTTNSVNTSGFSCRSFSTKKSGLKIMGWLWREESLQMTKLQIASLKTMKQKNLWGDHFCMRFSFPLNNTIIHSLCGYNLNSSKSSLSPLCSQQIKY